MGTDISNVDVLYPEFHDRDKPVIVALYIENVMLITH